MSPWAYPFAGACALIFLLGLGSWLLDIRDWWRRRHPAPPLLCEACGGQADLMLADGSTWCVVCDARARLAGYDNAPAVLLKEGAR